FYLANDSYFYSCLGNTLQLLHLFGYYSCPTVLQVTYSDPPVKVSSSPFTPVPGSRTLLLNAFHEHRTANRSVLLLAIVWHAEKTSYHCLLCCHDGELVTMAVVRNVHQTNFWFPAGTGDFLCQVPVGCQPRYAGTVVGLIAENVNTDSLAVLPILNPVERWSGFPLNFTVCLSNMFNHYDNVLQFVQAMELYRLLGAQRVVIYKNNCSSTMERVLHYYINQVGLVEVLPWPVDAHIKVSSSWLMSESPGDLHYYGQIPALNDCVHRYMYQTQYLLLHDPDEVILPTGMSSLVSTLQSIHGRDVNFYFENNVFPFEEKEEISRSWSHIPGVNVLLHLLREPIPKQHFTTGKMIVNPRTVDEMSVHSVHKLRKGTATIGPELGKLHHIRRRKNTSLKRSDLVRDEGLLRFAPQLVREVNRALRNMNLLPNKL
uniref:Glycosyltransferase family 92 protein n=1 Tax=Myripristis murdjan TaxID=586833 RepID=A0A667X7L5_9TELE